MSDQFALRVFANVIEPNDGRTSNARVIAFDTHHEAFNRPRGGHLQHAEAAVLIDASTYNELMAALQECESDVTTFGETRPHNWNEVRRVCAHINNLILKP